MFRLHNSKLYTFSITLLLIATSGTVIGGKLYYLPCLALLVFSSLLLFKDEFCLKTMIWFFTLSTLVFANFLLTGNQDYSTYISFFLKIIAIFIIFNSLNLKWVQSYFISIIAVISILSLPFFAFGLLFPDFIRSNIHTIDVWEAQLRVTPFYIYKEWWVDRNNGVYSEPGAFQTFINIAVYLTFKIDMKNKTKKRLHVLFFITILTTFSTTGYLVYGIILLSQYKKWLKSVSPKLLFLILLIISTVYFEENTIGTVKNKFSQDSYSHASFERRSYDLNVGLELLSQKPFLGWGLGNKEMYKGYQFDDSSNGLITMAAQFGLLFLLFYFVNYTIVLRRFSTNYIELFLIFAAFVVMSTSQDILLFPTFIAPMFIPATIQRRKNTVTHNFAL